MHSASLRLVTGRALGVAFAAFLAGGAAVVGLELVDRQHARGETCPQPAGSDRCRFVGGPLRISGTPVYLDNRQGAFLPTIEQVAFVDARGRRWTAPPNTLTDGASIPPLFAPVIGDRQRREFVLAGALHDAYCGIGNEGLSTYHTRSWEDVHRMFYEALLTGGTAPGIAKVMFAAVYLGGPRWNDPARSLDMMSDEELMHEMEGNMHWIEETDPDLDEIMVRMKAREDEMRAAHAGASGF